MADVFADPQLAARGAIVEADGVPMQGLVARLSRTPGAVRWAGRPLGSDDPAAWSVPAADLAPGGAAEGAQSDAGTDL